MENESSKSDQAPPESRKPGREPTPAQIAARHAVKTALAKAVLDKRLIVPASKSLLEQIADFRFGNRINSQSEAVRHLIKAGLEAESNRQKRGEPTR